MSLTTCHFITSIGTLPRVTLLPATSEPQVEPRQVKRPRLTPTPVTYQAPPKTAKASLRPRLTLAPATSLSQAPPVKGTTVIRSRKHASITEATTPKIAKASLQPKLILVPATTPSQTPPTGKPTATKPQHHDTEPVVDRYRGTSVLLNTWTRIFELAFFSSLVLLLSQSLSVA